MCFGRGLNNKINDIHERALWIIYQDKKISFKLYGNVTNLYEFI